jgi:hypothetical protein
VDQSTADQKQRSNPEVGSSQPAASGTAAGSGGATCRQVAYEVGESEPASEKREEAARKTSEY